MLNRTQIMGTGGLFRQNGSSIDQQGAFVNSAGGPATKEAIAHFSSSRPTGREYPLGDSLGEGLVAGLPSSPEDPDAEKGKKKRKRLLLLLLLLLLIFPVAYLLGSRGTEAPIRESAPSPVPSAESISTTEVEPANEVRVLKAETKPEATHAQLIAEREQGQLETEPIEIASIPEKISDVVMPVTQYDITYPAAIPPPLKTVKSKTNFVAFEVSANLQADPETRIFTMVPAPGAQGSASLLWSTLSGSVIFRAKDLIANPNGSQYVLYYIEPNGQAQRMLAFAVASGTELMIIPPRLPSRTVKRIVLTLEKNVKTKEGNALTRTEILYSDYKDKVSVLAPLR